MTLDASYRSTSGVAIRDPRVDQQTGQVAGQNFGFGQNRPEAIRVKSKETGIVTTLRPEHQGWRLAYERDVDGRLIDVWIPGGWPEV